MDQKSSNIFNKKPKPSHRFHSGHVYWQNVYQCFQCSRKKFKQMHHYKNFSQTSLMEENLSPLFPFPSARRFIFPLLKHFHVKLDSQCVRSQSLLRQQETKTVQNKKQKRIQNARFNCSRNKYKHQHKGAANKNKTGS